MAVEERVQGPQDKPSWVLLMDQCDQVIIILTKYVFAKKQLWLFYVCKHFRGVIILWVQFSQ
jgi:hypothetical protein